MYEAETRNEHTHTYGGEQKGQTFFSPLPMVNGLGAGGVWNSPERRAARALFAFSARRAWSAAFCYFSDLHVHVWQPAA